MLNIVEGKVERPTKGVFYGPEGIGKSSMASEAPDPLFVDVEGGTAQLNVRRIQKPGTWNELMGIVKEVAATPDVCRTLVLDTADWCEQLCIKHICEKHKQANLEAFNYGKGYQILAEEFERLLEAADAVIASGKNVIFLAHAKMRKQELPDEAGAFDRWEMKLTRQVAPLLKEWADMVLFLNYKTLVYTTENDTKKARGGKRVCYTTHNPCWDAKNRHNLPDEIDMDFSKVARFFTGYVAPAQKTPAEQMRELMAESGVTDGELQKVAAEKGGRPADADVGSYDDAFITKWVLPNWKHIVPLIEAARKEGGGTP